MGATAGMTVLSVGTKLIEAGAEKQSAKNARALAEYESAQLRYNGIQTQAGAQRDAIAVDRETQLNASRALAVAAASGGGASDPTVVRFIASNAADGAYRKALALYEGDDAARSMNMQADGVETGAKIADGQSRARRSVMVLEAGASGFGGYARGTSMRSKYSDNGTSVGVPYFVSKGKG